jgi:hypothetical protein
LRTRVEENVTIWLLGTLLTGFLAGIGVYRAIQDMAGLKIMSAAELKASSEQLAEMAQKKDAAEKRVTTAEVQLKQAYWAVRGTRITLVYSEASTGAAIEVKERLARVGALVSLTALDRKDPRRAGHLYYEPGDRDAAVQIKALASDLTFFAPEDDVDMKPGELTLWLADK